MVLIAGGVIDSSSYQGSESAEVFNPATGTFSAVGNMVTLRYGQTATLLGTGKVLLESGGGTCTQPLSCATQHINCHITCQNTAELYDPMSASFAATGNTEYGFSGQTAVLLGSGQVLVAGGESGYCTADSPSGPCVVDLATSVAELYDPDSGAFTPTGNMVYRRDGHAAAALLNGGAIEIGASPDSNHTAEVYHPTQGAFAATGELIQGRVGSTASFTATALSDGRVLVAGGEGEDGSTLAEAELYDPSTVSFKTTGSMNQARSDHTATLLRNGKVLLVGGTGNSYIPAVLQSAELYDPETGTFSSIGDMNLARTGHTATLLSDGRVLIAGGQVPLNPPPTPTCPPPPSLAPCIEHFTAATAHAEIYDPVNGTFTPTGDMTTPRSSHTATLLK
jgi:hypothetical protein